MRQLAQLLLMAGACALAGFAPPAGRPPVGPLARYEPKIYDISFEVLLTVAQATNLAPPERYSLENTPIVMPIVYLGTFHRVTSDTVNAKLWLDNRDTNPNLQIKEGFPHGTHLATLTIDRFSGQSIRWQLRYSTQVWSSRINDEQAALVNWPEEWPKDVQDALQPQMYIESDRPVFAQAVEHVSQGQLREVPPYLAAKDLIRYCINKINVTGDGVDRGGMNMMRGMEVSGAARAAERQLGTPHDLVCVCVAMLRAAGIPARPVIGVVENERRQTVFVSWGEFYLPDAGWVPFDPMSMRGKGVRTMDVRKPWPELGSLKDLNQRIPLAHHFMPPATVQTPVCPAVWGWDPQPHRDVTGTHQVVVHLTSRGKGTDDPK